MEECYRASTGPAGARKESQKSPALCAVQPRGCGVFQVNWRRMADANGRGPQGMDGSSSRGVIHGALSRLISGLGGAQPQGLNRRRPMKGLHWERRHPCRPSYLSRWLAAGRMPALPANPRCHRSFAPKSSSGPGSVPFMGYVPAPTRGASSVTQN